MAEILTFPVPAERGVLDASSAPLTIGLVNAMSDAALAITEQRFSRLMQAAFPDRKLTLRCVTLPQIARGEMAAARIARHYTALDAFLSAPPDAVIFTGAEPRTDDLRDEIFWPGLQTLFDWVRGERLPALFSCLAAHAAVLHFSGIGRRRLARKAFGMFEQVPAQDHDFLRGVPARFAVAHSRWNEVSAADLRAGGYAVLTRGPHTDADVFVPRDGLPHLYLQGHPEYEVSALYGEYRRDLRRFANGETRIVPAPPQEFAAGLPSDMHLVAGKLIQNWIGRRKEMAG